MRLINSITGIICLPFLHLSCQKEPLRIDREHEFNIPFKSALNEHIVLRNNNSQVLVQVKNISDKRCLHHLNCTDQGEATVRVEVSDTDNSTAESMLHIGSLMGESKSTDSVTLNLDSRWYVVTLHGVNPHPMENIGQAQMAELSVKPGR